MVLDELFTIRACTFRFADRFPKLQGRKDTNFPSYYKVL